MKKGKYELPSFLDGKIAEGKYKKWLGRKASSLFRRDIKRKITKISRAQYKDAIHEAVKDSHGNDYYSGEPLDWSLIGKYNNEESKKIGWEIKKKYSKLPTVDHVYGIENTEFKICSWKINDCKSDLNPQEFYQMCVTVLRHQKIKL